MKFILLLIAITTFGSTTNATELTGIVKSEDGKPLAGVEILTYAPAGAANILGRQVNKSTRRYEITTGADGTFRIPSHGKTVHFGRADLRPLTKILELTAKHIEVTMEDAAPSLWKIPACSTEDKAERVGTGFMLQSPEGLVVKKQTEPFERVLFSYRVGEQVELMVSWWDATALEPEDEYLLPPAQFSQRMWRSGEKWGYEFRGKLPNGRTWRRVAIKNGAIMYQANSERAIKAFDTMIDNVCFDESAVTW